MIGYELGASVRGYWYELGGLIIGRGIVLALRKYVRLSSLTKKDREGRFFDGRYTSGWKA